MNETESAEKFVARYQENVAKKLVDLLKKFNEDEGYNAGEIKPVWPLTTQAGTAVSSAADAADRIWYRIQATDDGGYTETFWLAEHDKYGFVFAEFLDGEEI